MIQDNEYTIKLRAPLNCHDSKHQLLVTAYKVCRGSAGIQYFKCWREQLSRLPTEATNQLYCSNSEQAANRRLLQATNGYNPGYSPAIALFRNRRATSRQAPSARNTRCRRTQQSTSLQLYEFMNTN
eukprot:jgi/Chrzof1/1109/Cz01g40130.t1